MSVTTQTPQGLAGLKTSPTEALNTAKIAARGLDFYYGDNKDYVGDLEDNLWSFGLGLGYQR